MNAQLPLFDAAASTRAKEPRTRQDAIKAAFARADESFREAYRAFVLQYADTHAEWIGEDVSAAYKRDRHNLLPREWRAVGHIYQQLIKSGQIERTGKYRERGQGSPSAIYRRVK